MESLRSGRAPNFLRRHLHQTILRQDEGGEIAAAAGHWQSATLKSKSEQQGILALNATRVQACRVVLELQASPRVVAEHYVRWSSPE